MRFTAITSRKNAMVRMASGIASSAKERKKYGLFFVEGARLCEDAAKSKFEIEKLFYTQSAYEKYTFYLEEAVRQAKEIYQIEEHVAELLAQTKHSQGVFGLCKIPVQQQVALEGKWIALENVQDPSNLGGIMRTAEALGMQGLLLIGGCDLYSSKVVRASMGAVFRMQIVACDNIDSLSGLLGIESMHCFAAVPDSSAEKLGEVFFPENAMVFIGNEGNGLTEEAIGFCRRKITIPMKGRAESFNAAAAAAICLWEISKT